MKRFSRSIGRFALVLALIGSLTASGNVVYENDFSTRTSSGAVPFGEWREVDYSTGSFLNDDYNNPFRESAIQDGWIRGRNACNCPTHIVDDNGNPEVVMHNASNINKHVVIKHRIGNTFTTGTVTAQCDFRAPTTWTGYSYVQDFVLGDENYFSYETEIENGGSLYFNYRAAQAGTGQKDGDRKFSHLVTSLGTSVRVWGDKASNATWYRVVISVNLDTRKYAVDFYELGDSHPSLDTPTPSTAAFSLSNIDMPFEAVTSISAIGLTCYSPHGGSDTSSLDLSEAGQFDNVRVSHNGIECYVNDFSSRRSRALGGMTTATYTASCLVTNTVGSETYPVGASLYPAAVNNKTISQPVGIDGWRRINSDLGATPTVYTETGDGNPVIRFGSTDDQVYGVAAATLGQTLRTGKVRATADIRALGIGGTDTKQSVNMYLGSDDFYTANYEQYSASAGRFASIGIVGTNTKIDDSTYRRPKYQTSSGSEYGIGDEWVKQGTWLRFEIEADLDAGTYSCSIRDQGKAHPGGATADGETVYYSKSGIAKVDSSVDSISSIGFGMFAANAKIDNIKVWHTPTGASAETLVYDNRIHQRIIYGQDIREDRLVGTLAKNPVGQDGWVRANVGTVRAVVRDDGEGNQALTFGNGQGTLAYALHDIGTMCESGKMTTQVDACPPSGWLGGSRNSYFWLGGDKFHEGNLKDGDEAFYKWGAVLFGFRDKADATGPGGVYTNVTLCAYSGDGDGGGEYVYADIAVDPTHWYRFVARTSFETSLTDVLVYDLGTEHPTLETETPATPVATFTALPFRRAMPELGGISSLGISAMGTLDNTVSGKANVYWDNILIDYRPKKGLVVILR